MSKHTDVWKAAERVAAADIDGRRTGAAGRAAPDAESSWAVVEVKTRKTLPAWLTAAMAQAEGAANRTMTPKLALLRLHEVGGRYADDIVCMRAGDFAAWYGDYRGRGDPEEG